MPLADGSRLGPYLIIRKIGQGGMGEVYEAIHLTIERRVAIKILHAELAREPEIATRFGNEARIVNRISHPGLVQVFDYNQHTDGRFYIVMEYLEGESLTARLVRHRGKLPVREILALFLQLGSAMAAAHEKGVTHRDLKPDNVMIVPDRDHPDRERVKLLDFGLAKLSDRSGTRSDVIMGTPHYMSPEQCRGAKSVTDKSDIYSLGVMLFEVLAGRLPFTVPEVGELISMHMFTDTPPLSGVAPDVPEKLATLVDQMLGKAPDSRPGITQVLQVFAEVANALPRPHPPAGPEPTSAVPPRVDGYQPTMMATPPPGFFLGNSELRKLLEQHLRTDSAFDAFLIDYFPQLKRRFAAGMDPVAKTNLLIELTDRRVLAASLRRAFPLGFVRLLIIAEGPEDGRIYPLPSPGEVVIGRGVDADIRLAQDLDNRLVSRRHAVLEISNHEIYIRLEGKRPFLVNGQPVTHRRLLITGDRIAIGTTQFLLETAFRMLAQADTPGNATPPERDWAEATDQLETEKPAVHPSDRGGDAYRVFWGLTDRVLEMGRIPEAERMIKPRFDELRHRAESGELLPDGLVAAALARALTLAEATKNDQWSRSIFELAAVCKHRMPKPFAEALYAHLFALRPAIAPQIRAYLQAIGDDEPTRTFLQSLLVLCGG